MSNKPLIAVTMGDPSGIGPEVVAKALSSPDVTSLCNAMVIGNAPLLAKTAQDLGIYLDIPQVSSVNEAEKHAISVLDMGNLNAEDVVPGELSAASGSNGPLQELLDTCNQPYLQLLLLLSFAISEPLGSVS